MHLLSQPDEIESFCARAREHGSVALDTEFERERTYKPILQLLQVATPEESVIIDPLAAEDLGPIWDLVADPAIETILHAAGQDLEIFYDQTRTLPHNIFDTQVAGALLGMGEQPGYADLLRRILGIRLKKHERVTEWGQRPLRQAQLEYALDDVRYLHQVRDDLNARLEKKGRQEWLQQELSRFEQSSTFELDHTRLWQRVSRHRSLRGASLAVLRELASWRETTAESRNIPRNRVVQDEIMVEVARRCPTELEELRQLRRLHPREVERSGEAMLAAVARGVATPETAWPRLPEIPEEDPELNVTTDLLAVFVRHRARRSSIAPSYLGTKKDLTRLVDHYRHDRLEEDGIRLLHGWRFELVGRDLLRVLNGELALSVDPENTRVRVREDES